jgi:hypothetical protein
MTMSSPNRLRHVLDKLAVEPPGTKTSLLRSLLPEIERALASGKAWRQVWQRLAEEGLEIIYKTFHRLLRRVRKKSGVTAAPSGKSFELTNPNIVDTAPTSEHGSLANLRRVEANRPGLHSQPKSLDELVHGRTASNAPTEYPAK